MPPRLSPQYVLSALERMTDRDRRIVRDLIRFRVLTAEQITRLHFASLSRARHRLLALYRLRVVERFRCCVRCEYHYTVGEMGLHVAARSGEDVPVWKPQKVLALAASQRLDHYVGVNDFAIRLLARAKAVPDGEMWWMTERACESFVGEVVKPDGHGIFREFDDEIEFFLEYDRSTETLERVVKQVGRYRHLEEERGKSTWVLYVVRSRQREANIHRELRATDVPVATAVLDGAEPHDAVWRPIGQQGPLVTLAGLARYAKPLGAIAREEQGGRYPARYERWLDSRRHDHA